MQTKCSIPHEKLEQLRNEASLSLREEELPMNLLGYNQLKVILQQAEERLPSGLKVAIQDQNWYVYNNYTISRFTITNHGYLHNL